MPFQTVEPLGGGRYQLRGVLGTGGMATVYRAWDTLLEVERAIKVLAPHLSNSPSIRRRFLSEARTMAKLKHPAVVTVHDLGQDDDRVFIVMELIDGGSLQDRMLSDGPLSAREAARVVGDLLGALAVAHSHGVIHRDVKPHNVLVTHDGRTLLTDFGIAQVADGNAGLTRTGAMMGTLAYMAPEQRTDAKRADARADLYAAGATFYALLSGLPPHDLYIEKERERQLAGLPEALAVLITQSTAYDPDDRPSSASEMREMVLALLPTLTDEARPKPDVKVRVRSLEPEPREPASETISFGGGGVDSWGEGGAGLGAGGVLAVASPASSPLPAAATMAALGLSTLQEGAGPTAAPEVTEDGQLTIAPQPRATEPPSTPRQGRPAARTGLLAALAAVGLAIAAGGWWLSTRVAVDGAPTPRQPAVVTQTRDPGASSAAAAVPDGAASPGPTLGADKTPDPGELTSVQADPALVPTTSAPQASPQPATTRPATPPPAATEPEAAEQGYLAISSVQNAKIWVDGEALGNQPKRVELQVGSHTVKWVSSTGKELVRTAQVQAEGMRVECWDIELESRCQ